MDDYALTRVFNWSGYSRLCASSLNFFRNCRPTTGKETNDVSSSLLCAESKIEFNAISITCYSSLVGIIEGKRRAVHCCAMARIKAEQECSSALLCIRFDLHSDLIDS